MTQFQVQKAALNQTRFVEQSGGDAQPGEGEILVRVERFGFSANNITYAAMGDVIGYWQFFPPQENNHGDWGVVPVWGFGEVTASNSHDIPIGERLFGYFPPASSIIMKPAGASPAHFFDASAHRSELPKGYNLYQRVAAEPGYDKTGDDLRMLLFPLYITSYCLWDQLKENDWYGAEQVIIVSASSKTSIGLAYALKDDEAAPKTVGLTSSGNQSFVDTLDIYEGSATYDDLTAIANVPTVIVDMSGNGALLGQLHEQLGENMRFTLNVGLTHWEDVGSNDKLIRERSEVFFAPSVIQKRMKEWGPGEFNKKSSTFVMQTAMKSMSWLKLEKTKGLDGLEAIYQDALAGKIDPNIGIIIEL